MLFSGEQITSPTKYEIDIGVPGGKEVEYRLHNKWRVHLMKQICVIGVGYVGLVTATCFADLGNEVIGLDINEERIAGLKRGQLPIYEPGLEELVLRNMEAGRLSFTTSYQEALSGTEFAFIAVGTPSGVDGEADLQYVEASAKSILLINAT